LLRISLQRFTVPLAMCDTPRTPCAPAPNPTVLPGELGACSRPSRYAPREEPARRLAARVQLTSALRREIHIQVKYTPPSLPSLFSATTPSALCATGEPLYQYLPISLHALCVLPVYPAPVCCVHCPLPPSPRAHCRHTPAAAHFATELHLENTLAAAASIRAEKGASRAEAPTCAEQGRARAAARFVPDKERYEWRRSFVPD
jgi:hypothetical protein